MELVSPFLAKLRSFLIDPLPVNTGSYNNLFKLRLEDLVESEGLVGDPVQALGHCADPLQVVGEASVLALCIVDEPVALGEKLGRARFNRWIQNPCFAKIAQELAEGAPLMLREQFSTLFFTNPLALAKTNDDVMSEGVFALCHLPHRESDTCHQLREHLASCDLQCEVVDLITVHSRAIWRHNAQCSAASTAQNNS